MKIRFTTIRRQRPIISAGKLMGPCSYCNRVYYEDASSVHFIPCVFCTDPSDALEHAGCQH